MTRDEQRAYKEILDAVFSVPVGVEYHWLGTRARSETLEADLVGYKLSAKEIASSRQFKNFVERFPKYIAQRIADAIDINVQERSDKLSKRLLIDQIGSTLKKREMKKFVELFGVADLDEIDGEPNEAF